MICPNCGDIELVKGICPRCKSKPRTHIDIADLSSERPLKNKGEADAVIEEIRRIIRMMGLENTIDYSDGFFPFQKIRRNKLLERIEEINESTKNISEVS